MRQYPRSGAVTRVAFLSAMTAAALINTLSCSDALGPRTDEGLSADSLAVAESRVATVSVSLDPPTISVGQTAQATAQLLDTRGNVLTRDVIWSSGNPAVATVSATGLVTAVGVGITQITASRYRHSGSALLTVQTSSTPPPTGASVSSVTVSPSTVSVTVGSAQVLMATVRDSAGAVLTDRAVSWASSNSSVATVDGSGKVSGVAAGTATITATSGGVSGTVNVTVSAPPPPPTGGAPEPVSGNVVLWQDGLDGSNPLAVYGKRGTLQVIPDGHSGQAVRFIYTGSSPDNLIEKVFANTHDIYVRYWFRIQKGWVPYSGHSGSGMKWFMLWRPDPDYVRYTFGVGKLVEPNYQFTSHDNSSTQMPVLGFPQNVSLTPRFDTVNDGQWHKYTIHVNGASGTGGEQIWIDDVLVLDDFAQHYDHDDTGFEMIQLPGTVVDGIPAGMEGTIDIDDLAIWHK
jgi:uncharacterized protein YjdB